MGNQQFKAYTLNNFRELPQIQRIPEGQQFDIEVVGNILPFKTNNYVVDELIDWNNLHNDPFFALTFPQKKMLNPFHYERMKAELCDGRNPQKIEEASEKIRMDLNPHPAGQLEFNIPSLHGEDLNGIQHKYNETVLFFPSQGQTCHAFCSFCFRWPVRKWERTKILFRRDKPPHRVSPVSPRGYRCFVYRRRPVGDECRRLSLLYKGTT